MNSYRLTTTPTGNTTIQYGDRRGIITESSATLTRANDRPLKWDGNARTDIPATDKRSILRAIASTGDEEFALITGF